MATGHRVDDIVVREKGNGTGRSSSAFWEPSGSRAALISAVDNACFSSLKTKHGIFWAYPALTAISHFSATVAIALI